MKELLQETYARVKRNTGVSPQTPQGFRRTIGNPDSFKMYVKSLAEGLSDVEKATFYKLCKNQRISLMENSMYQLNPYESLNMPLLRNFMPKLIAKELVNVMPIDKPEVIQGFIKPKFRKYYADNSSGLQQTGWDYSFPSITNDISRGPRIAPGTLNVSATADTTSTEPTDIFAGAGLNPTTTPAHIEKDLTLVTIYDSTGASTTLNIPIMTTVDGNFTATVTHTNGDTDVITGAVDFLNGSIIVKSMNGNTSAVDYVAYISLEENTISPEVKFDIEKIRLTVVERAIKAMWTVNMEQDVKALYDLQLQSEIVNILGDQIALDIDREIITSIISANSTRNGASHLKSFSKKPPSTFLLGQKEWLQNILPVLNELSATIYNDTRIQAANTLACNPLDAALFESLNGFEYLGDSTAGGEVGYRSATVAAGKWKILVSSVVPVNNIVCKYRSDDLTRASFIYAPYVPALLVPYPLDHNPTMSLMSRYATKVIRPEAFGVLTINESGS